MSENLNNKTCGECKHCTDKKVIATCKHVGVTTGDIPGSNCKWFEQKKITNGDKIIAGGMRAVAVFAWKQRGFGTQCDNCAYATKTECKRPADKTCIDGIEAWLNAPAVCVTQNAKNDTQTNLCCTDNTQDQEAKE